MFAFAAVVDYRELRTTDAKSVELHERVCEELSRTGT